jgi:hypothetical protein
VLWRHPAVTTRNHERAAARLCPTLNCPTQAKTRLGWATRPTLDHPFPIVISSAAGSSANADDPAESRNLLFRLRQPNKLGLSAVTTESEEMGLPGLLETSQTAGHKKLYTRFPSRYSEPRLASKKRTRTWAPGWVSQAWYWVANLVCQALVLGC